MELVCPSITFVQRVRTSREPTEPRTELFQCSVFSTIQHDTLTKAVESARVQSLSISNHGTLISLSSLTFARITVRKKCEPEICSTLSGHLICSWNVCKIMLTGPSSVQMSVLVYKTLMVTNSKNCIIPMKHKAWLARLYQLEKFGTRLLKRKSKQVHLTCSTRMLRTSSPTKRTWEPSVHPTCALRLWSTLPLTKSLFATSHRSHYQSMLRTVRSITIFSSMSHTMLLVISTESSMSTTTQ